MPKGLFDRLQNTLAERAPSDGLTLADLMALPSAERRLVNWMTRSGDVTWSEITTQVGSSEQAQLLLDTLRTKGFIQPLEGQPLEGQALEGQALEGLDTPRYRVRIAPRRKRKVPTGLWKILTDKLSKEAGE